MRLFFSKHELKLRRKRTIAAIICVVLVLGVYWILTRPQKAAPEMPTVIVEPVVKDDVEIYGEYVGRIRAQQFVEVRARVEGYLENMLFAEGTYVNKNQVLFVINQDQYRAKADKARAQLKKDEAQALKAERDLKRIRPLFEQNAASQLDLDNAEAAYESAEATVAMSEADLAQAEMPTVIVEPVVKDDVEIYGEYVGRIRAQQFVEVRARVEGYLENMLFAEGTYVNKNQVLFVINQDQYRAKADKARAQLKKDEAQALKAERDLKRIRPLFEQNAASQLDLDNAEAAYESAEATVAMSEADLAQAELELGYTIVRSPLSGHISERNVDLGTLVGPGGKSLLATIVKSDTVLVDFSMTALDYLKSKERNINLGQQDSTRSWQPNITITLADNTVYPFKGYVDFAEPQVDPQTGTFSVRAEMPNPKQVLLPGQFTKVKLLLDVREGALVVPMKAVTIEKGGAYIYTMRRDNAVEKRFIELGPEVGNNVVVERGLAEGEMVVVEGFHKLTPGMKVRVSQPDAEAQDSITATKNEVAGAKENVTGTKDNAKGE